MQLGKIAGICFITVGIALLTVQIAWVIAARAPLQQASKKVERDFKSSPYAGIFGVALIVGGIGFVFTAKRKDEFSSRRLR